MKPILSAMILVLVTVTGCGTMTTVTTGPMADRGYLTKTDSFLGLTSSKVKVCSVAGLSASGCQDVKVE